MVQIFKVLDIRDVLALIPFAFRARREAVKHEVDLQIKEASSSSGPMRENNSVRVDSSSIRDSAEGKTAHEHLTEAQLLTRDESG